MKIIEQSNLSAINALKRQIKELEQRIKQLESELLKLKGKA